MTLQDGGWAAYQRGDFAAALSSWQQLAQQNNAQACHNIALLYFNGEGVEQDAVMGQEWCVKAANLGNVRAKSHLGFLFSEKGLPETACKWWREAAQAGDADAQNQLGLAYYVGVGVAQDNEEAADWFEAAALQNHAEAQFNLGVLYANGKQWVHARHWWTKAAQLGNEQAQNALTQIAEMENK